MKFVDVKWQKCGKVQQVLFYIKSKRVAEPQRGVSYPWHTFHFNTYLPESSYAGQGESSLQNFLISTDVELEGYPRWGPDLVHHANRVILKYL